MRRIIPWLVMGLILCIAPLAFSQSILVWDKDHDKTIPDPETGVYVDATYGVTKALGDCGYAYTTVKVLPSDLSSYDILFVVMGTYC